MEKGTGWTDLKIQLSWFSVDSAFRKHKVEAKPSTDPRALLSRLVSMCVWRRIDCWEKRKTGVWGGGEGGDTTTAKWLWHARPSLLSCRAYILGVGCWCTSLSVRHFAQRSAASIDRSPFCSREKRKRSIISLCVFGGGVGVWEKIKIWEQYASLEETVENVGIECLDRYLFFFSQMYVFFFENNSLHLGSCDPKSYPILFGRWWWWRTCAHTK